MNLRHISGDMPQAIGVYCLSSSKGEYIGSSNNIMQRMKTHDGNLHSGGAAHLLQSVVDAGESFRVSVLQILPEGCTNYELKNAEAEWIKKEIKILITPEFSCVCLQPILPLIGVPVVAQWKGI